MQKIKYKSPQNTDNNNTIRKICVGADAYIRPFGFVRSLRDDVGIVPYK